MERQLEGTIKESQTGKGYLKIEYDETREDILHVETDELSLTAMLIIINHAVKKIIDSAMDIMEDNGLDARF